jgi:mannose-6-phosphate isomerase-like protein (cupin superfamily)
MPNRLVGYSAPKRSLLTSSLLLRWALGSHLAAITTTAASFSLRKGALASNGPSCPLSGALIEFTDMSKAFISKDGRHGPFATADGSTKTEIAGEYWTIATNQSVAQCVLDPGYATWEIYNPKSEEIVLITSGRGRVRHADTETPVTAGDAIVIVAGTRRKIYNDGDDTLAWLSCCAPGYNGDNVVVTEGPQAHP